MSPRAVIMACALGLGVFTGVEPAAALPWSLCSEAIKPSCLSFRQPDDMTCRLSVERYITQERDFRQCIVDEANAKTNESRERANRVIKQWNEGVQ